ncbi:hypothetical protein V865_006022 [Kwoniella europaea PYCC6329]|uniref:Uncharacterized protein n=1 Tax=Kwoniella europaea PYCC6329 TaxID=1423913 RepID=A0AAX4KQS8_9TREE
MPTRAGQPPPPCSSLPSQGTIHIPDVLDVLMQPIRRDKRHLDWDGEAFPIPDEMIIKNWDLPQGYTRESWADWEPENPFIAERHYDHDPLAPNEGYGQDEMEGIFGRMAERKMAEEDEGHIVEAPSTDPSTDLSVEKGIPESTTPRLITSTTEIHIANTLLSPSGGQLVPNKLSVPTTVSAKSGQPSKTVSYDSTAASRDRLVSSQGASTQAEDSSALDRVEEIAQDSTNDQLEEDAINEYIDLDPDSAGLSDAVEYVSSDSLSAPRVSRTTATNFIPQQPNSTSKEDGLREDHKSQSDNGLGSPTPVGKAISTPTISPDHSDTHATQITQEVLLPALEIEVEAVTKPSMENVDSPATSSTPSSPRSPHLVTPGTDTRVSQGREEGIQVLERPLQSSLTDESDMDIPQIVQPRIKANTVTTDHHIVQMPSTPSVSQPSESSPLSTYATDPSHFPRDSRSTNSSSLSQSYDSTEDETIISSVPRVPASSNDIDQSPNNLIPPDLTLESSQRSEFSGLERDSASGVPLPATNDIHNIIDNLPLSESDPLDNMAGTSISEDPKHGVGALATCQETRKTTDANTSSISEQDTSKDDKMEVLMFIAGQKKSDNSNGHDDGPILIDIDSESPDNDDHSKAPASSEMGHEKSHEEQGLIEMEIPESPMTIAELKKGDEEEEGFDEDKEHESISESCDIELTSNANVAEIIDVDMTQDNIPAEATFIEEDQQPESTISKPKGKPELPPQQLHLEEGDRQDPQKIKRGPGRPPMKHLKGQNEDTLDADACEEKPGKSRMLTTSKPTTIRMPSTSTSRGRSKTMFTRTQPTQTAIDRPKRGRKGKANALYSMQDEETVVVDTDAPTELESKRLPSSSSPVQQPPIRRAAQNANAAFKIQDGDREVRPKIKPVQKRKQPLPLDPSKSDSDSLSQRHISKKVCKGETLKRWTLVEDACLLRCWDGKSVLSPAIISQACDALLDPAVESLGRTHEAVKYRLRQVYKNPDFLERAKAFNERKPSASAMIE